MKWKVEGSCTEELEVCVELSKTLARPVSLTSSSERQNKEKASEKYDVLRGEVASRRGCVLLAIEG